MDLSLIDDASRKQLHWILANHTGGLTPTLRSLLEDLGGSNALKLPPTPVSTPRRSAKNARTASPLLEASSFQNLPQETATNGQLAPTGDIDEEIDSLIENLLYPGGSLPDNDDEIDCLINNLLCDSLPDQSPRSDPYASYRSELLDTRPSQRRRLENKNMDNEEYEERGRRAQRGNRSIRRRRRRSQSSCHRGAGVVPPARYAYYGAAAEPLATTSNIGVTTTFPPAATASTSLASYLSPFLSALQTKTVRVVACTAGRSLKLLHDNTYRKQWMSDILLGASPSELAPSSDDDHGMAYFSERCYKADLLDAQAKLARMLSMFALSAKIQASVEPGKEPSLKKIWDKVMEPTNPKYNFEQWRRWYGRGRQWGMWGRAGGIYLLLLIVHAGNISDWEQVGQKDVSNMAYIFRQPQQGGAITELISRIYAPLILKLCRTFPIRVGHLFDRKTLQAFGRADDIPLENWESSDPFFDSLKTNTFKLPARDMTVWKLEDEDTDSHTEDDAVTISLGNVTDSILHLTSKMSPNVAPTRCSLGPLAAEPPDIATSEHWTWTDVLDAIAKADGPDHIKIKTALNLAHPKNGFTLRGASRKKTLDFTREHRALARLALEPKNLDEFRKTLQAQLLHGYRLDISRYLVYDADVLLPSERNKFVHILEQSGQPAAVFFPPVPDDLKNALLPLAESMFPGIIKNYSSLEETESHRFQALHKTWYNRFARKGDSAPNEGAPGEAWMMGREGAKRQDPRQSMPYVCKEADDDRFGDFQSAIQDITDWLSQCLRKLLGEDCTILNVYCEALPGADQPPVYPFAGIVLNFNVSTRGHRDHGDKKICLLLSCQDGSGGDIVLDELGLVIRLHSGHPLLFRSCDITHFNMPFVGKRISLVFHSDQEGDAWAMDRNGWASKSYFL